jgi:hypothetical protein
MMEVLAPCVQDGSDADVGTEVPCGRLQSL